MNLLGATVSHRSVAAVYGTGEYGCGRYEQGDICQTGGTTQDTSPLAPLTGFLREQPPTVVIPALLLAAVFIGSVSFLITRAIRRHRSKL